MEGFNFDDDVTAVEVAAALVELMEASEATGALLSLVVDALASVDEEVRNHHQALELAADIFSRLDVDVERLKSRSRGLESDMADLEAEFLTHRDMVNATFEDNGFYQ